MIASSLPEKGGEKYSAALEFDSHMPIAQLLLELQDVQLVEIKGNEYASIVLKSAQTWKSFDSHKRWVVTNIPLLLGVVYLNGIKF